jgi:hypothetical protein
MGCLPPRLCQQVQGWYRDRGKAEAEAEAGAGAECERLWAVEHLESHNIQSAISSLLALVTTGPLHEGDGHDD